MEKYAKAATILKELESSSTSANERVAAASNLIAGRVEKVLAETQGTAALSPRGHRIALALIVGLPWLVLSVVGLVEAVRRNPDWQYGFFGCLALAILLGGVSFGIPTDVHWFYRYVVFPLAIYSALLGFFFVAGEEDIKSERGSGGNEQAGGLDEQQAR